MRPLAVLALALTLTACSGSDPAPAPQAAGSPAAPPPASAAPTPTPATTQPPLGTKLRMDTSDGVKGTVVATQWLQPITGVDVKAKQGNEWGAANVEFCLEALGEAEGITISWNPWALYFADGTLVAALGGHVHEPAYPYDGRRLVPGRCFKGWVTFEVPAGKRPAAVQYEAAGKVVNWSV